MKRNEAQLWDHLEEFVAFARQRVGDPELAADLVQESLLKALKATENLGEHENVRAWFYRILRRTIIDLYRHRDVERRALEKLSREFDTAVTDEEEAIACRCLKLLIPGLTPRYATLIERLDLKGEAPAAVAADLKVTPNNLTVRLHRARRQLKQRVRATCRVCATHGCTDCSCQPTAERKG